jgi:hypothetical protein
MPSLVSQMVASFFFQFAVELATLLNNSQIEGQTSE